MALSTKTEIDGLWIGVSSTDDDADVLRKVCDAVALVATYDPIRYRRILRDVHRIWVTLLPGAWGCFVARTRSCYINSSFAAAADPMFIASIIVHEACHARTNRFGYDEPVRYRLEKLCRRQEYAFAERHPDGQVVQAWLDAFPPLRMEKLTNKASAKRVRRGAMKAAREIGIPSWLIRVMASLGDCLQRRSSKGTESGSL